MTGATLHDRQPVSPGAAPDLAALSPEERRTLLRAMLAGDGEAAPRVVPMSFAQQRLWFLDQLVPGNPFYVIDSAIRLRGALDVVALERSLREICRRHETLRTTFGRVAGRPVQIVHARGNLCLEHLPPIDGPGHERTARAVEAIRAVARQPFDLAHGPVVRAALLALAPDDHVLVLTMHHIVSDGWSMGVLVSELSALYGAFRAGAPSPLAPLPVQYADFAEWQHARLQGEGLRSQIDYWRARLAGAPQLELPTDRPRPAVATFAGGHVSWELPPAVAHGVRELARREGATLFMVLLAAFQALLHRYTGQHDIVVGTPVHGRDRAELEPLIGFFVNTLALRTTLSGDATFRALVAQVRDMTLDAFARQELPFERLVEELRPERDLSRNPLYQVVFALQNTPTSALTLEGLDVSFPSVSNDTTRFDLVLNVWEADRRDPLQALHAPMHARLEYNRDLFDRETAEALGRHFTALLASVAADADQPIACIPLLSPAERRQLLVTWNATATPVPAAAGIHALVEARVAEAPERPAVADGARALTYAELDAAANRLAHHLVSLGVRAGDLVAVCVQPSCDWVVALLGTLKAGAAYVALDPTQPPERLARMLRDAAPAALVTDGVLALDGASRAGCVGHIVRLDVDGAAIARAPADAPRMPVDARSPAYVIYTSGTTGEPSGVLLEHAGLLNLATWHQRFHGVIPADRASQVAGPGFDASTWELWPYLAAGASVHIAGAERQRDPVALAAWLAAERITLSFLPTPLAEAVLAAPLPPGLTLRTLLTGGDRLHRARPPLPFALVNHYGPTEYTIVTTAAAVPPAAPDDEAPPPIGRPIANTRVYVVDGAGELVPPRVAGELLVSGPGLARGYLARPELDSQRFTANPFADGSPEHARVYRTGDRVRWRHDGQLEFLGRIDTQVSVRGVRIEVGEVEAMLMQHPAVAEAAVAPHVDAGRATHLAAYIVRSAEDRRRDETAARDLVAHWRTLYDETYGTARGAEITAADSTFDITGWHSSYTGLPIPPAEMREWVEATVARIREAQPRRVLEIGCGTGLLLHRLAPACDTYVATDFSAVALEQLAVGVRAADLCQVQLVERRADAIDDLVADGGFDAVVLNSVVQYFPGAEYLLRVLRRAIAAVRPGGRVFVGDVRSLPLQRAFHLSVELHCAPASMSTAQLASRVRARAAREEELLIAPRWFAALAAEEPRIADVHVWVKRGRFHNELTRFRYDVALDVRAPAADGERIAPAGRDEPWLDWARDCGSLAELARAFDDRGADALVVRAVPNARLWRETAALALLADARPPATVGELRDRLRDASGSAARAPTATVDPEHVCTLAAEHGYDAELLWARHGADGRFDVRLRRRGGGSLGTVPVGWRRGDPFAAERGDAPGTLRRRLLGDTNDPLQATVGQRLVPELRAFLRDRLPEHMVPTWFTFVDALPLTRNGKIDRAALPEPATGRDGADGEWVGPRTPVEEVIAAVWSELLGVDRVGVRDNFFHLGGHSLLGTQLVARLRDLFEVNLPVLRVFEAPTVEGLAWALLEDPAQRDAVERRAATARADALQ